MHTLTYFLLYSLCVTLLLSSVGAQDEQGAGPARDLPDKIYPSGPLLYNEVYQPVQDPGFEDTPTVEQTEPWITWGWAKINTDPAFARNGSNSIFFNATLVPPQVDFIHSFGLRQQIAVFPGFFYTFQFWAKTIPNPSGVSHCNVDICIGRLCTRSTKDEGTGPLSQGGLMTEEWSYYKRRWQVPGGGVSTARDRELIVPVPPADKVPEPIVYSFSIYAAQCYAYLLIDDVTMELDHYQYEWTGI